MEKTQCLQQYNEIFFQNFDFSRYFWHENLKQGVMPKVQQPWNLFRTGLVPKCNSFIFYISTPDLIKIEALEIYSCVTGTLTLPFLDFLLHNTVSKENNETSILMPISDCTHSNCEKRRKTFTGNKHPIDRATSKVLNFDAQ